MAEADDSGVSVQVGKQEEPDSSLAQNSSPVVFECSECNSIVGDSTSWLVSNKHLRSITLKHVTSKVAVGTELKTCQTGVDEGSTYRHLYCACCNEMLGKKYIASNAVFDLERAGYTFLVEKLNCYEIGSAEVGGTSDLMDFITVSSPRQLDEQVSKIRVMIMAINDRVSTIESLLAPTAIEKPNGADQGPTGNNNADSPSLQDAADSVTSHEAVLNDVEELSTIATASPVEWMNSYGPASSSRKTTPEFMTQEHQTCQPLAKERGYESLSGYVRRLASRPQVVQRSTAGQPGLVPGEGVLDQRVQSRRQGIEQCPPSSPLKVGQQPFKPVNPAQNVSHLDGQCTPLNSPRSIRYGAQLKENVGRVQHMQGTVGQEQVARGRLRKRARLSDIDNP